MRATYVQIGGLALAALSASAFVLAPSGASAQSNPGLSYGQVPTAAQWNSYFARKQDVLSYVPLGTGGGSLTGRLSTAPSTANGAGFSLNLGAAPSAPNNGDLWATSSGFFGQINNTTIQFAPKASPTFTGTVTLPTLAVTGTGSTGDVSGMSVTANSSTQNLSTLFLGERVLGATRSEIPNIVVMPWVKSITISGCTAVDDVGRGSRYVRGASSGPMAIADATGAYWQLAKSSVVDAGAFCPDVTGATDSTTAMQAAAVQAVAWGAAFKVPPGQIKISGTLTFDVSGSSNDLSTRFDISGYGRGLSKLVWAGTSGCLFNLIGGANAANHGLSTVSELTLYGNGQGTAICASKLSDMAFRDLFVQSWNTGYSLTDMLSTQWAGGTTTFNTYGISAAKGTQSYPNALSFFGHRCANNTENCADIIGGSGFNYFGGSIEGNGIGGSTTKKGGVFLEQPGAEGGVAADFTGVYFEGNNGSSDINLAMGTYPVSLGLFGSTFARVNATNFVQSNIIVTGAATAAPYLVSAKGNAFRESGAYVASGSQPYFNLTNALATGTLDADPAENAFMTSSIAPSPISLKPVARVRFDGTLASPTPIFQNNVSSITKNGTGDYTITLTRPTQVNAKSFTVVSSAGPLIGQIFAESYGTVRVRIFNTSAAATDALVTLNIFDS